MKKVLILASVASMIGQFNMENIRLLKELGYEVHVACNFQKGNTFDYDNVKNLEKHLREQNVRYFQIDFSRNIYEIKQIFVSYIQTKKLVETYNYKFIHCHSPIGGVIGRLVAHKSMTKVIYTAHGFHFCHKGALKNWLFYYPIEKLLSKYTDVLITINREDFSLAQKKFDAKKVVYIPGVGISTNKIGQTVIERKIIRDKLGITDSDFVLISVGELNRNKNHKVILYALKKLKGEKLHYLICGKGELRGKLEILAKKLGIESQVHFLGYRTDVIELCKASDCFVFPSKREGLGIAALEGMASGLPLISSDSGGIKDYSRNGITGYCVGCSDVNGFSNSIKKLLDNQELCKTMGTYNQALAKKFDVCYTEKIMKQVYRDIGK